MPSRPPRYYKKFKIRRCQTLHHCEVCQKDITQGQTYYDGGYGRRAHESCVPFDNHLGNPVINK